MEYEMSFDVQDAMAWILYIALFPITFYWMRRAYKIFIKKDYSEVALKKGEPPKNPKKWAPLVGIINLIASIIIIYVIVKVSLFAFYSSNPLKFVSYHFNAWSSIVGPAIWIKIILDFIIKQQAHPFKFGRKKDETA
jgi:NADH:ubiquinone oxidoreductase subunit 5 (subunit L)/multisubunit Na+/H+ antiporter MnhA subunit